MVIQEVTVTSSVKYQKYRPNTTFYFPLGPGKFAQWRQHYLEAFPVAAGATTTELSSLPNTVIASFTKSDVTIPKGLQGSDWFGVFSTTVMQPKRGPSKGTLSFSGTAWYFDGLTSDDLKKRYGFTIDQNLTLAGRLLSLSLYVRANQVVPPRLMRLPHSAPASHAIYLSWDWAVNNGQTYYTATL
jgi:hypothetical protein